MASTCENLQVRASESNIWGELGEEFDSSIQRLTAITVKENDYSVGYSYPVPMDRLGYYFDFTNKTGYDNPPKFRIDFAEYEYPNLQNSCGRNHIIFQKSAFYPSLIKRKFSYSNLGLDCTEYFGNPIQDALLWRIEAKCLTTGFKLEKMLYTVLSSDFEFSVVSGESGVEIAFDDMKYYMAYNRSTAIGLYKDENSMKAQLSLGSPFTEVSKRESLYTEVNNSILKKGNYLVLAQKIELAPGENITFDFGLSSVSAKLAEKALKCADIEGTVSSRWNKWFNSLGYYPFKDEREKKAYYKCWWVIRSNYYDHPRWGRMVLEALPVYKGLWQWAIAAIEWHSDQNTEYTSEWIKKALDMFTEYQREDGYITHAIYIDEDKPGESWAQSGIGTVQTPMLPWAALRYYYTTLDMESLKRWYGHFVSYYEYLCRTRDDAFMKLHLWGITTSYDTGLDTTSVFQRVTYGENGIKEDYCYPAIFAAERCRYETTLGTIAGILGYDGTQWLKAAEATKEAMNKHLWDNEKRWYGVIHQDGTLDTRVGVDGLFPLAYHVVDAGRASLMEENFKKLIGEYGIRTVAQDEPGFCAGTYWRGPAWPKTSSLGMETAKYYYPQLVDKVHSAVLNMALKHPNIWECCNASTGELARSDQGFLCTPGVSSNVGAGEIIGALLIGKGFGMLGADDMLPLAEFANYHWAGLRISVTRENGNWFVYAEKAEKDKGTVNFIDSNGAVHRKEILKTGVKEAIF